ncbi:MAG: DUF2017 family protein [Candidatus Microbacterium colombiense]|nr:MAG: DUF2017 family protein [Microbacterium sp.]
MDSTFLVSLAHLEGVHLVQLVDDLADLIGADRDLDDPAVARLTPSPYPDDADAAKDFATSTRDEILDRRHHDAQTVGEALREFRTDTESLPEGTALATREIVIDSADVDAWMRTLTSLRLIIATRLGITSDDDHDPDDARYGIYDWLGYRLELLIQAADEGG